MMRRLLWLIVGLCLGGGVTVAFAEDYPAPWGAAYGTSFDVGKWTFESGGVPYATAAAACIGGGYSGGSSGVDKLLTAVTHDVYCLNSLGQQITRYAREVRRCTAGGTLNNTTGMCMGAPACVAPLVRDAATGLCVEPPCQAGDESTMRLHVGYAKTQNNTDDWINPGWASSACEGQCVVTVGALQVGTCTVDPTAGPPYPGFCDFKVSTTGATCTTAQQTASQQATNPPPIPCPSGTMAGEVNGIGGCYPYSETTETTETTQNPDGSTTKTTTRTNSDGSTTTTTQTCTGDGACTTTTQNFNGGAGSNGGSNEGGGGEGGSGEGGVPGDGSTKLDPDTGLKDGIETELCKANPTAEGCQGQGGNFGSPEGKLYEKGTKTFGDVLSEFRGTIEGSGFYNAAGGFFSVSAGGSCPTWAASVPLINTTITIDQLCHSEMAWAIQLAGYVLLLGFGWVAFRIAIL